MSNCLTTCLKGILQPWKRVSRAPLVVAHRVGTQHHRRDNPKRALRADKYLVEVGANRSGSVASGLNN